MGFDEMGIANRRESAKQRSWSVAVPTMGGPVNYLRIFDGQAEIRIPEELRMGEDGTYIFSHIEWSYRWHPRT